MATSRSCGSAGSPSRGSAPSTPLPHTVRILLENLLRRAGTRDVADEDIAALAAWPGPARDVAFMPAPRADAGLHGRAGGGGPRRDAQRRRARGRRPEHREPAGAGGPRDRPLRAGRPVPHRRCLRGEHRLRVPAQRGALPIPPLGPAGVRQRARGAARRRHLPPGQPGAPRAGRDRSRRARVSGHGRRYRFAHDDDQRPGHPRMGGRGDRGRGGDARPADRAAAADRRRRAHARRVAGGHDGDRPRADPHADAACPRRGGLVRGVHRRRALDAADRRPGHAVEHVPGVRRDLRVLPDR